MSKIQYLIGIILLCFLPGCNDNEPDAPVSVPYTLLVYMAAEEKKMTSEVSYTLDQLKAGIKESTGTVVVYLDDRDALPRLFRIDSEGNEILLKSYPEQNSAEAGTLATVIQDTKQEVPNERFGLILWSHAMGWLPINHSSTKSAELKKGEAVDFPHTRYFAIDEQTGTQGGSRVMEIDQMAKALPDRTAEFILFDVCLMGNVEALYQLRHTCDYFIASTAEVLAEAGYEASGMPYEQVLPKLFGTKEDLADACRIYYNHYNAKSGQLRSATISLIDARELDALYGVCREILQGKLSEVENSDVSSFQIYHTKNVPAVFFDLADYIRANSTDVQYNAFTAQLNRTVPYKAATAKFIDFTIDPAHYSGLSVYVPLSRWKSTPEYAYYFSSMLWSQLYINNDER